MDFIIAKDYLCFNALLEMIVSDINSSSHFSQVEFAEIFGITVPKGIQVPIKNVQYSNDVAQCGTNVCVDTINDFFRNNLIPLKLSYISASYFDEITFGDIIFEKSKKSYIVFAFCYGLLYDESQNNDVGHVVLLEKIDTETDTIQIYDPGPRNHGSKTVKVDDMVYAMKRRGGVYLFEKVNR